MPDIGKKNESNWVQARAACNIVLLFNQLAERVQQDVEETNDLVEELDYYQYSFIYEARDKNSFFVERKRKNHAGPQDGAFVYFHLDLFAKHILVNEKQNSDRGRITCHWDYDNQKCVIEFRKKTFSEAWQISREALGSLFFEADDTA